MERELTVAFQGQLGSGGERERSMETSESPQESGGVATFSHIYSSNSPLVEDADTFSNEIFNQPPTCIEFSLEDFGFCRRNHLLLSVCPIRSVRICNYT